LETCRRIEGLVDFIAGRYNNAVEIGIGHSPEVAFALLSRDINVFATDISPNSSRDRYRAKLNDNIPHTYRFDKTIPRKA
jgi:uncharacterized UPF0146 family protein